MYEKNVFDFNFKKEKKMRIPEEERSVIFFKFLFVKD